jgi:hypothetical protein
MWHTAELSLQIPANLYDSMIEGLRQIEGTPVNSKYKDNGVTLSFFKTNESYISYNVIAKINFSKLLQAEEHVDLVTDADTEKILEHLNQIIDELFNHYDPEIYRLYGKITLSDFTVRRIDYTTQIDNLSQEEINLYIRCVSKGDTSKLPKLKSGKQQYDENRNYRKKYKNSFYHSNQSVTLNIYDKRQQLIEKQAPQAAIDKATGILRIEVQCKEGKVSAIARKYKTGKSLDGYLDAKISKDMIRYYLSNVAGTQPYTTTNIIKTKINNRYKSKTKDRLLSLIDCISIQNKQLSEVQDELYQQRADFKRDLKYIEALGYNPVPLPINSAIKNLPNLIDRLQFDE